MGRFAIGGEWAACCRGGDRLHSFSISGSVTMTAGQVEYILHHFDSLVNVFPHRQETQRLRREEGPLMESSMKSMKAAELPYLIVQAQNQNGTMAMT